MIVACRFAGEQMQREPLGFRNGVFRRSQLNRPRRHSSNLNICCGSASEFAVSQVLRTLSVRRTWCQGSLHRCWGLRVYPFGSTSVHGHAHLRNRRQVGDSLSPWRMRRSATRSSRRLLVFLWWEGKCPPPSKEVVRGAGEVMLDQGGDETLLAWRGGSRRECNAFRLMWSQRYGFLEEPGDFRHA